MLGAGVDRNRLSAPHFAFPVDEPRFTASGAGLGTADKEEFPEFVELENWDFEETIRHARQLVRSVTSDPDADAGVAPSEPLRAEPQVDSEPSAAASQSAGRSGGTVAWLILAIGLGVFTCGAALIGLALVRHSTPLWQLGLPMVLSGQVAVLFVVIWQLEVVWHGHRATFVALHALDEQLRQLRRHDAPDPADYVSVPAGPGRSGAGGTTSAGAAASSSGASTRAASGPPSWAARPRNR